jgi:hypothetical protein
MRPTFEAVGVVAILSVGFASGLAILHLLTPPAEIVSRQLWELDPQGQSENLGAEACRQAGRVPYYVYPDGVTPFYEECLP